MRRVVSIVVDFAIGDIVYLRCRDDPLRGRVVSYYVLPGLLVLYNVTWGHGGDTRHYGFELSDHHELYYDHGAPGGAPASEGR